jgi:Protein of unknown function (DUF3684)
MGWNQELVAIAGLFGRIMFDNEMSMMQNIFQSLDSSNEEWLFKKYAHTLNSFTCKKSTPSPYGTID